MQILRNEAREFVQKLCSLFANWYPPGTLLERAMVLETPRLQLLVDSLENARAKIAAMPPEHLEHVSAEWLESIESAREGDFWVLGFQIQLREADRVVGQCGFKGPPSAEGVVEISYYVYPDHEGKGFGTESARAMTEHALSQDGVTIVRAHTLPEQNASTRILEKCEFEKIGEVTDPDDGQVWRWEKEVR